MIFLHGSTMTKEGMSPIVRQFKEYNCFVLDLTGHGCEDKIVLSPAAIETWKQIPDSQLLMVPYGGHALIFEDGKLISRKIHLQFPNRII